MDLSSPLPSPAGSIHTRHLRSSPSELSQQHWESGSFVESLGPDEEERIVWPLKKLKATAQHPPIAGPSQHRTLPSDSDHITRPAHPVTDSIVGEAKARTPQRLTSNDLLPFSSSQLFEDASPIDPYMLSGMDNDANDYFQPRPEPGLLHHPRPSGDYSHPSSNAVGKAPSPRKLASAAPIDIEFIDDCVARILEIMPDARQDRVVDLILRHLSTSQDKVVDRVVSALCDGTTSSRPDKGKGKAPDLDDANLEELRQLLLRNYQHPSEDATTEVSEKSGEGIECGCCFSVHPVHEMIQCPDAHVFCSSCIRSYASGLLGAHNPNIVCMDQSSCKLPFPDSELRRMLDVKLMDLYDRIKQMKEIEAAGLENLESCPFCEYKVVIDDEDEKLLWCENSECRAVTCRDCKKLHHFPKPCQEVEERLEGRHRIEEAMFMRNCPKCQKAFIKETGCNKIVCPNCHTSSCYVCRQVIHGYDHFRSRNCTLWDPVEERYDQEITIAAEHALAEYNLENPDKGMDGMDVDLLLAAPGAAGAAEPPLRPVAEMRMLPLPPAIVPPPQRPPSTPAAFTLHANVVSHQPEISAPQPVPFHAAYPFRQLLIPPPPPLFLLAGNPAFIQPLDAVPMTADGYFVNQHPFNHTAFTRTLPMSPSGSTAPLVPPLTSRPLPVAPRPWPPQTPPQYQMVPDRSGAEDGRQLPPIPSHGIYDIPSRHGWPTPPLSHTPSPQPELEKHSSPEDGRPPPSPQYGILDLPSRRARGTPSSHTRSSQLYPHHGKDGQPTPSPQYGILDLPSRRASISQLQPPGLSPLDSDSDFDSDDEYEEDDAEPQPSPQYGILDLPSKRAVVVASLAA